MVLRFSITDALERGLITADRANELRNEFRKDKFSDLKRQLGKSESRNSNDATSKPANHITPAKSGEKSPQELIFDGLNRLYPNMAMWEVGGLVPGRRYRADIYLPESRVVVEMDGFIAHRGKEQFKVDREKRNQLVMSGYPVIAFYYAQVKDNLPQVLSDICACHDFYKPLANEMFWRGLKFQLTRENRTDLLAMNFPSLHEIY